MSRNTTSRSNSHTATETAKAQKRSETTRANQPPFPTFNLKYFIQGRGNGSLACNIRVRNTHPINICRNLIPQVDTPQSPPFEDRRPDYGLSAPSCSYSTDTVSVQSISNHFNGMAVSETPTLVDYSDCVVVGSLVHQIQSEAVNDYSNKTAISGETFAEQKARRRAFLDGMSARRFLLMPRGASQAVACNGN